MQFGKPDNPGVVDFTLTKAPAINSKSFDKSSLSGELYTGGTGWGMKDWKGKLYPEKTPVKSFLHEYGKQFRTVELNSLFYNIPKPVTIDNWREAVPNDFRFCPKILQYISHSKKLGVDTDRIINFQDTIALFEDNLGPSFMQLPPYFDVSRYSILEKFLESWGNSLELAIEFRHPSWFDSDIHLDRMLELLHSHGKGAVITDVGGRRDVCHMGVTSDYAFIRFVGNDLHSSDFTRIDMWLQRIYEWFDKGLKEIYFFIHEPDNLFAPEISSYLHAQIPFDVSFVSRGPILYNEEDQLKLF
ncbi:MAG: DUF72 domain-containing protein [Bacteroidia bacterium]|nr:DUF72 domain-containing protein [Bacteroidia bacterium]